MLSKRTIRACQAVAVVAILTPLAKNAGWGGALLLCLYSFVALNERLAAPSSSDATP